MNDNDKAAHFIGWKVGQQLFCAVCAQLATEDCPWSADTCTHAASKVAAPDMSDPRNYMKALETLSYNDDLLEFPSFEFSYANVLKTWEFEVFSNGAETRLVAHSQKPTLGEAIIETLAALYDASKEPR